MLILSPLRGLTNNTRAVRTPVSDKSWDLYVVVERCEEWHGSAILSLAL